MQKIYIHPLFILFCLLLLLSGKAIELGAAALAVGLHEAGHYYCAKNRGFALKNLSLMPYGAVMYAEDGLPDVDSRRIAFAGPLVNIVIALSIGTLWWFFPVAYPLTKELFVANCGIGLFNLFPCYPLDGSRIWMSFSRKKKMMLKILRVCGILFGIVCAAFFIASLFFTPVYYLLFLSVMFFVGAGFEGKKESFRLLVSELYFVENDGLPPEEKTLLVRADTKLSRLTTALTGRYYYRLKIIKEDKEIACLTGQTIERLFFANRNWTVEEFLLQNSLVGV